MPRRRLKSLEDIRRYLGGLINRVEGGEIEVVMSGKLGYLASILVRIIESSDLEKRIDILEKKLIKK